MDEENNDKIDLTLSFTKKQMKEMKATLESYEKRELLDDYFTGKLKFWAYKSIEAHIHSMDLQMRLKP